MIDIHNHILYGVDEGALNLTQSIHMLQKLYIEGVRTIVATPNYGVGCVNASKHELLMKLSILEQETKKIDKDYRVCLGNELYYSDDSLEYLRKGFVHTLAGTRYVLVNYNYSISYEELKTSLHRLLIQGYYPIISQIDKYDCLYEAYDKVEELIQLGACTQLDSNMLFQGVFHKKRNHIKKLLSYDFIHFISSSAKSDISTDYGMKEAYHCISLRYGKERAKQLFYEHGEMLLTNMNIVRVS